MKQTSTTFQQRVRDAIRQSRYDSVYALVKAGVLRKPTISGWLRKKKPRLPFTPALLNFADETGVNLNYLLLDEGPPLRGQVAKLDDLEVAVRAHVLAALAARGINRHFLAEHLPDGRTICRRIVREYGDFLEPWLQSQRDLRREKAFQSDRWVAGKSKFNPPVPEERPELWTDMDTERARRDARRLKTRAATRQRRNPRGSLTGVRSRP